MSPQDVNPTDTIHPQPAGFGWPWGTQWKGFLLTSCGVELGKHGHRHIVGASLTHRVSHSQLEDVSSFLQAGHPQGSWLRYLTGLGKRAEHRL